MKKQKIFYLNAKWMVAGFASRRHQCCLSFALIMMLISPLQTKEQLRWETWRSPLQKPGKVSHFARATVGQSEMHRPANTVTWIMHNPLCPDFRKWCGSVPTPPHLFQHRLKLLFMWQRSCWETISHIRTLKLIERDAGDKEREQRQLFVTSLHLTGIIRYMKLKFHTGGSCWQHGFLFCSLPPFFLLCSCLC